MSDIEDAPSDVQPDLPDGTMATSLPPEEVDQLTDGIVAALKTVFDPEIPTRRCSR